MDFHQIESSFNSEFSEIVNIVFQCECGKNFRLIIQTLLELESLDIFQIIWVIFLLIFCFFTEELFSWKKSRYQCQSAQNSLKRRGMWFLAGVRKYVCVCACVRFSTFQTPITYKRLEISIWNLVHQWSNHIPLILTFLMTIDAQSEILISNFLKNVCGNFRKNWAIVLKLYTKIIHRSRTFNIEFD